MEATLVPVKDVEVPEKFRRESSQDLDIQNRLLQQSIKVIGLRFPIRVRPDTKGGYVLIDGARRLAAVKALRVDKIPAYIVDDEKADLDVLRYQANVQRENLKPMEEAKLIRALIVDEGLKKEDVARMVGKEPSTIERYLNILQINDKWAKLVNDGVISMWDVKPIAALTSKGQRHVYGEIKRRDLPFSKSVVASITAALDPVKDPELFSKPKVVAAARINEKIGHPVAIRKVEGIAEMKAVAAHHKRTLREYEERISLAAPVIVKALASKDVCEVFMPSTLKAFREFVAEYEG
jgi:ParB/RepB/Spo0J family partition protein